MVTEQQRADWSRPPVDDVGYLPSADLAAMGDAELKAMMDQMERTRYTGWRNYGDLWLTGQKLDRTEGKRVLDFGCGTGIEAARYARTGNTVSLADISLPNLVLAARVMRLYGHEPAAVHLLEDGPPFIRGIDGTLDVVHASGVVHHIPDPVPVVEAMAGWLAPGGELRLMLYTDVCWRLVTGTEPPADVTGHPQRERYVREMDQVGEWADWYSPQRLEDRFGRWFTLEDAQYISPNGRYMTAVMVKR